MYRGRYKKIATYTGLDGTTGTAFTIVAGGFTLTAGALTVTAGEIVTQSALVPNSTRTDRSLSIGTRATEKDVTMAAAVSQHLEPIQINLNFIGSAPTSTSTVNVFYMQLTHDTTAMANLRLKGADWTIGVGVNLQDVYVYQGEVDFTAGSITVGGEAAVMSLNMNGGSSAVTGNLRGLIINIYGAGLPSSTSIGLELRTDGGSAVLAEGMRIWSVGGNSITTAVKVAGTVAVFADFDDVAGEACTEDGSEASTWAGRIAVVTPDGNAGYINLYSTRN